MLEIAAGQVGDEFRVGNLLPNVLENPRKASDDRCNQSDEMLVRCTNFVRGVRTKARTNCAVIRYVI